jgi:hypothetical protein
MLARLADRHRGRLVPPLEGLAYRFTVFLPVLSQGRAVFTDRQLAVLIDLDCCGGCSQSSLEGHPPWHGFWRAAGRETAAICDQHVLLVVYALQNTEAVIFFQQLNWALQQEQVAGQEVVLIEQLPVRLIEAVEIS